MKRREALKFVGLMGLLGSIPSLAGCSWKSVYTAIREYVPVGLQAFVGILGVLSGGGIISLGANAAIDAVIALVNKAFGDVTTAVAQLQATPPVGTVATISAVLNTLSANIAKFMSDINVPDGQLAALVSGLANVILSTLAGFQTQLPNQPVATTVSAPHSFRIAGQTVTVFAKKRSLSQFKHEYNALAMQYGHAEIALK